MTSFLPMAAIAESGKGILKVEQRPYAAVRRGYTFVADGDVLFAKITPCMQNGKHAVARGLKDGLGFASTEFHVLRPHRGVVEPEWVHGFLLQTEVLRAAERVLTGAVGQQRVPQSFLEQLQLEVPPLAEQRRIAARLSEQLAAVGRARNAAQARLEAALQVGRAQLRTLFGSAEARAWTRKRLEGFAEIVGGIQKSPARAPVTNHRPFLTVRNVQRGYLDLSVVEHFEVTPREVERLRLRAGDILVVEGNGSLDHIGRNALFVDDGQEWVHQNHVIRVRLDQRVCVPQFVSRFLNSDQGWEQMVEKARTTSGLFTLSAGKVALLEIPVPSLPVQEQAISTLDAAAGSAGAALSALRDELTTVEALPAALLRGVFGQVD